METQILTLQEQTLINIFKNMHNDELLTFFDHLFKDIIKTNGGYDISHKFYIFMNTIRKQIPPKKKTVVLKHSIGFYLNFNFNKETILRLQSLGKMEPYDLPMMIQF